MQAFDTGNPNGWSASHPLRSADRCDEGNSIGAGIHFEKR